jgi:hypothetical protein
MDPQSKVGVHVLVRNFYFGSRSSYYIKVGEIEEEVEGFILFLEL